MNLLLSLSALLFVSTSAFAQPGQDRVTVDGVSSKLNLQQIAISDKNVALEKQEIEKLSQQVLNPCEQQELELRLKEVEFYEKHKEQIEAIYATILKGLRKQKALLADFENGIAEDEAIARMINAHGEEEESAVISFKVHHETQGHITKTILLKDLIRYIKKFEAEAKTVSDDPAEVEKFLDKYRVPSRSSDPEYFNMSLEEARQAYSVRLSSVFAISNRQSQERRLILGEGKNVFAVAITTVLGYDPKYGTTVGSGLLSPSAAKAPTVAATMIQTFGEAYANAKEENLWNVIRSQQLTLEGVPLDGLMRRKYWDAKRNPECQKTVYDFNEKSASGPFLPYSDKKVCTNQGIEILNAAVINTDQGGTTNAFEFTEKLNSMANHERVYEIPKLSSTLPVGMLKGTSELTITYRCDCSKAPITITYIESLVIPKRNCEWGCASTGNEHMVGWNYSNLRNLLSQARALYGPDVLIEIQSINNVTGWNPNGGGTMETVHSALNIKNDVEIADVLSHLRMVTVSSLPPEDAPYRWTFQIILPNGKRIAPANSKKLECPQK